MQLSWIEFDISNDFLRRLNYYYNMRDHLIKIKIWFLKYKIEI